MVAGFRFLRTGALLGTALETDDEVEQPERDEFNEQRAYEGPPALDASREDKANYSVARYVVQNDHYSGLYRQWAKPIYFLVGKQWLIWDPRTVNYNLDTDVPEWRQQPVTNYTYAVYRAAMAKLSKNKPTLEVVPPSGDSEDREAANLGEAILEFLWRYLKKPSKVMRALGWLLCAGKVYFNVDWDSEAGELRPRSVLVEMPDPQNPGQTTDVECACDEAGEPLRRTSTGPDDVALDGGDPYDTDAEPLMEPTGEIDFTVDDPMCVRLNPEATSEDDAEEMFVAKLIPTHRVANLFDLSEEEEIELLGSATPNNDEGDNRSDVENLLSSVAAAPPDPFNAKAATLGSSQEEALGERTLVIWYYRKHCAREGYPEGRYWVTAGGKLVWPKEDDKQYAKGEAPLPFKFWPPRVPVVDTPIPGQPDGVALLSQVVPLNEQLNHHDGKIGEFHTMMAMGGVIWVHPDDKDIVITSEPGQVKKSKGYGLHGKPPLREKLEALPAAVYQEREVLRQKIQSVAGMSDVDLSQRPEGVTAGRAFLVLQEASDAPFMPLLMAIEEALCEVGRRELVIAQQKYTEPRTIKIRGAKGEWEFRSFTGADLRDGLDVRVQVGSMYPWSKSAQWDTKLSLVQALPQLVVKPDGSVDKEALARYLDSGVPGLQAFESEEDPDLVEIDREHAMFEAYDPTSGEASNQLPQLAFWQNQVKHQEYHYNFMKRNYARFTRWSAAAQEAFLEHLRLTTEAVAELVNQVIPDANANGGGGESGQPPGAPGGAPGAEKGAPGGKKVALVPPGGTEGRLRTPTAAPKQSQMRLTRADRAAAGQ